MGKPVGTPHLDVCEIVDENPLPAEAVVPPSIPDSERFRERGSGQVRPVSPAPLAIGRRAPAV